MIYTIYGETDRQWGANPMTLADPADDLVAVPEKLAPWALIAPPIWLAVHRLWWWLAAYILFVLLTMAISATSYAVIAMVISWLPGVYLLLEGRELYRRKLEENGMALIDLVNADSESEAVGRHIQRVQLDIARQPVGNPVDQNLPVTPVPVTSAAPSTGVFGLFPHGES